MNTDAPKTSNEIEDLRVVCAWCGQVYSTDGDRQKLEDPKPGVMYSHGICTACYRKITDEKTVSDSPENK